jgi:hypothetical protein
MVGVNVMVGEEYSSIVTGAPEVGDIEVGVIVREEGKKGVYEAVIVGKLSVFPCTSV